VYQFEGVGQLVPRRNLDTILWNNCCQVVELKNLKKWKKWIFAVGAADQKEIYMPHFIFQLRPQPCQNFPLFPTTDLARALTS
jgi:hypothetical protein